MTPALTLTCLRGMLHDQLGLDLDSLYDTP